MRYVFALMGLLLATGSWANERGNGGDAVVCRSANGEITSAELLDYYEGRTLRKFDVVEMGLSNEDLYHRIGAMLKLNEDDPYLEFEDEAIALDQALHDFLYNRGIDHNIIFTEDELTDIPDSRELILKKGCQVEQVAIRVQQQFPEDPEFIFQADILRHLSARDIRGLVLHETLYHFVINRQQQQSLIVSDSIVTRYLHQKIMSRSLEQFTFRDYARILIVLYEHEDIMVDRIFKRGHLRFELSSLVSLPDGTFYASDFKNRVRLWLDKDGYPDLNRSLEKGSINFTALSEPFAVGMTEATLYITTKGKTYPFKLDGSRREVPFYFGDVEMEIVIPANPKFAGYEMQTGIVYKVDSSTKFNLTRKVILSANEQRIHVKFNIRLDEKFNVVMEEL